MNFTRIALAAISCIVFSAPAFAQASFTMNFDGIPAAGTPAEGPNPGEYGSDILGYYNGDPGLEPTFPRSGNQNWGVTFAPGALAITPEADGGIGQFDAALSLPSAAGSQLRDGTSFELSTGLYLASMNLWYNAGGAGSNPSVQLFSGGVSVYNELLGLCGDVGPDTFCGWDSYAVPDSVLDDFFAKGQAITKVVLGGTGNRVVFDDVFLSTAAIPEPSTYALMLLGLAAVAGLARRRSS